MCAPFRLAARERVVLQIMRMGQVIDAVDQRAEKPSIGDNAADRNTAEADAV